MRLHRKKRKHRFTTTYILSGGFLIAIILGTLLLMLPFSSGNGTSANWSDALFTATTSVCVTGLVTVPTYTWSYFGQAVILVLIQLGGLGVISFTLLFMQLLGQRMGMKESQLIRDAYNLDTNKGMNILVKKIFKGTFLVEGIGACLYALVFIPQHGLRGIWESVFNAVSAFCNAGMDILGPNSLIDYQGNLPVNLITMALIVTGGIGFPIWFLIIDKIKEYKNGKMTFKKIIKSMPLYAKAVLFMTAVLIFGGALIIFIMEYSNDRTIGNMSFGGKVLASIFQSVTTRTAGFCTIPQEGLRRCTIIVCCILMFIGGSPSGTAGGIKTTTFMILMASFLSGISERNNTEIFKRKINAETVRKATSVFSLSFSVMIMSLIAFCAVQPGAFEDCIYEVVSAIGTVGLTRDLTSSLTLPAKLIIVVTMYLGRIGPISLALFFNTKKNVNLIQYPEENLPVG